MYYVTIECGHHSASPAHDRAGDKAMRTTYILATITGSDLVDASGRSTGPEVSRIYSHHRTLAGAYKAQRSCAGWASCPVILTADGQRLSKDDAQELDLLQSGWRPAHRPRRDPAAARVVRAYRVHPDTADRIVAESKRTGESQGQVIDRVVAAQIQPVVHAPHVDNP